MDTGGPKGRPHDISGEKLYALFEKRLGIPSSFVVNEYGMTELGTQYYDTVLADHLAGLNRTRAKAIPRWARLRIVNPETSVDCEEGEPGILVHYDITNRGSVLAVETSDIGIRIGDRFEITGRAEGAESRGCSLNEGMSHLPLARTQK